MGVLYPCCAGLDVHKETVVACVRDTEGPTVRRELRTFGTTTPALLAPRDWLEAQGVTHVALESTGVLWKPVWHVLEDACTLVLGNAQEIRNVPGRKSDTTLDCRSPRPRSDPGELVPPPPIQELAT
jgi:transposase